MWRHALYMCTYWVQRSCRLRHVNTTFTLTPLFDRLLWLPGQGIDWQSWISQLSSRHGDLRHCLYLYRKPVPQCFEHAVQDPHGPKLPGNITQLPWLKGIAFIGDILQCLTCNYINYMADGCILYLLLTYLPEGAGLSDSSLRTRYQYTDIYNHQQLDDTCRGQVYKVTTDNSQSLSHTDYLCNLYR